MNLTRLRATFSSALVAVLAAASAAPAAAGWWDDAAKARETTLEDLAASPAAWRDVPVSLVVRFGRAAAAPQAGDAAVEWVAFSATSKKGGASDRFVARRGSAEAARIAALREGDEVRVRAVVRDGGRGAPLFEVVFVAGAADALSPEELATLRRADDFMAKDNAGAAEPLVRSVLDGREFVPAVRAELWRRIARAERSQKKLADAAASFEKALAAAPGDAASARELAELRDVLASAASRAAAQPAAPSDASARSARPVPKAPAAEELPPPTVRLAPPRDRDGAPVPPPTPAPAAAPASPPTVPAPPAAATPPAPVEPPPPAPKLAAPR